MCEILLRVVDKVNISNPKLDAQCTKRGDVIVLVDNEWTWGIDELNSTFWVIVKLPNIPKNAIENLLEEELVDKLANPYWQRRGRKVDVDLMPSNLKNKIKPGTVSTFDLTLDQLKTYVVNKTPINDPQIIG